MAGGSDIISTSAAVCVLVVLLGVLTSVGNDDSQHLSLLNASPHLTTYQKYKHFLTEPYNPLPPGTHEKIITIQFCQSWQFNNAYTQFNRFITSSAADPNVRVRPQSYKGPLISRIISGVITIIQYGFIAILLAGNEGINQIPGLGKLLQPLVEPHGALYPYWQHLQVNKVTFLLVAFFGGNICKQFVTHAHSFELYIGHTLVHSTIMTQRLPTPDELIEALRNHNIPLRA